MATDSAVHLGKRFIRGPAVLKLLGNVKGKSIAVFGQDKGYYAGVLSGKGARAVEIDGESAELFDHAVLDMTLQHAQTKPQLNRLAGDAAKVLKKDGTAIITIPHPLGAKNIETKCIKKEFPDKHAYFDRGAQIHVTLFKEDGAEMFFDDYHWTLEDYFEALRKSGLAVTALTEPRPKGAAVKKCDCELEHEVRQPNYIVLQAVKR